MKLIVASIPLFFILIGIEILAARILEKKVYRLPDSIADLGCGMIEQLLGVLAKGSLFAVYLAIYANARILDLSEASWAVFAVCFVAVDFLYYWFHRMSHEIGAFWAAHSVHHQSEEYNLTVALRQGAFQGFISWVYYLPLALIGFPPAVFLTCSALNTLYQFWIHTRLVGRLGPIEWIFNTPSHHRVHHGRNPRYIDRNHAGVFIVWDRLFGTFVPETDEPVYGIVKPFSSFNPLWANFAAWADLARVSRNGATFADRVRPFTNAPGWRPASLGGPLIPPEVSRETEPTPPPTPRALGIYVFIQFVAVLALTAVSLGKAAAMDSWLFARIAAFVTASLVIFAALLEGKIWARAAEAARVVLLAGLGFAFGADLARVLFGNL